MGQSRHVGISKKDHFSSSIDKLGKRRSGSGRLCRVSCSGLLYGFYPTILRGRGLGNGAAFPHFFFFLMSSHYRYYLLSSSDQHKSRTIRTFIAPECILLCTALFGCSAFGEKKWGPCDPNIFRLWALGQDYEHSMVGGLFWPLDSDTHFSVITPLSWYQLSSAAVLFFTLLSQVGIVRSPPKEFSARAEYYKQ